MVQGREDPQRDREITFAQPKIMKELTEVKEMVKTMSESRIDRNTSGGIKSQTSLGQAMDKHKSEVITEYQSQRTGHDGQMFHPTYRSSETNLDS